MIEAFVWGAVGASALLFGALIAYFFMPGRQAIAVVMALGTGLLIGSVSFELIDEALKTSTVGWVGLLLLVGAAVFAVGDWILDSRGASERKDMSGKQAGGSPLAIVLGSVLDGIPESFVLGLTVLQGGVSVSLLAGITLSNLPEGMASSSGLKAAGWPRQRVVLMWLAVDRRLRGRRRARLRHPRCGERPHGRASASVRGGRTAGDVRGHAPTGGVRGGRPVDWSARGRRLCDLNCSQCYLGATR